MVPIGQKCRDRQEYRDNGMAEFLTVRTGKPVPRAHASAS